MNTPATPDTGPATLVTIAPDGRPYYSLDVASELAGVHPELVRYYWRRGFFNSTRPGAGPDPLFDDDALYELRRIEHYRLHYGVSRRALPLVCRLLREVARLETEVRFFKD